MLHAVFGAGGFGREVAPVWEASLAADGRNHEVVFVSDFVEAINNGRRVLALTDLTTNDRIVVAVADGAARRALVKRCEVAGLVFGNVFPPDYRCYEDVEIGEGAIICPGAKLTCNIRIGRHFHANLNSYAAHDCRIGDFVTFAPNVCCNGNVTIEDDVYIGTGALLRQGVTIGAGAVVGMGAVVVKDVPAGVTVVGNPARVMDR